MEQETKIGYPNKELVAEWVLGVGLGGFNWGRCYSLSLLHYGLVLLHIFVVIVSCYDLFPDTCFA